MGDMSCKLPILRVPTPSNSCGPFLAPVRKDVSRLTNVGVHRPDRESMHADMVELLDLVLTSQDDARHGTQGTVSRAREWR